MFNIIETLAQPIKVVAEPLPLGFVAQFDETGATCILSDGTNPFGIIGSIDQHGLTDIHYESMEFETDIYEADIQYKENSLLYVNSAAMLTSKKPNEGSILVGKVKIPPTELETKMTVSWI